ncbi:MAG TPA: hemolysin family protein [Jiangellaceae bacterium]
MNDLGALPALLLSVAIIALSAFFVAVEFALVAARRHRLEEAAETRLSARAALRSSRDLSLLLAGAQLGITLCLVALGALAKPAVKDLLTPVIELTGAPSVIANAGGFILALVIVTFIHLVVGEMAPKSWAIAHPERSAIMLALPMRAFMWVTHPILLSLNGMANWCVRKVGVEPVDEVGMGQSPDALRELVNHSAEVGTLDEARRHHLATALSVNTRPIGELVTPAAHVSTVDINTSAEQIKQAAQETGHLRLVVRRGGDIVGVVHVRDTLDAEPGASAATLMNAPLPRLAASTPIYQAINTMRETRAHVALATAQGGRILGIVTLQDLVDQLLAGQEAATA